MDVVFLLLTILGIIIAIIFGYLQVAVPFIKGEVRLSKRFPFVESAEAAPAVAPHKKRRKKKRKRRFLIPILAVGILVILFVLIRFLVFQTRTIERVPLAIISFTNRTGEQRFDYLREAIPNLLITNLEQSRHLSIMTWERMHDLLKVLGKEDVRAVDEDLGFEICEMDDIQAIVIGSFTKAGDVFVTEVKVLDVRTKKLLKSASSEGEGVASILKTQIDDLSKDIARGVSRYERVIETTKFEIMEVTTTSMDAYNYFLRGREEHEKLYYDEALRFLTKSIEFDSTFAAAHYYLARTYLGLKEFNKMAEVLEKAKVFAQKATEKERLYIEQLYTQWIEKDWEKQGQISQQLVKKYPKEKWAHYLLGGHYYSFEKMHAQAIEEYTKVIELDPYFGKALNGLAYEYVHLGDFNKALEYANRYALVSPGDANPFDTMGEIYIWMGNFDEAITRFNQAVEIKPNFYSSYAGIAYVHALQEDYAEAIKYINQFIKIAPSVGIKAEGYWWKGFYYYLLGNFESSQSDLNRAADVMKEVGYERERSQIYLTRAWIYVEQGQFDLCRKYFKQWIDIRGKTPYRKINYNLCLGLVDLKQGHIQSAKSRLAEMQDLLQEIEPNEWSQFYYDLLHVEVLLAEDMVDRTIMVYKHELNTPGYDGKNIWPAIRYNLYHEKDLVARTYLKKDDLDMAMAEYERLTTLNSNSRDRRLIRPTYHYKLATLYEEKGLKAKAIAEYEKFLDIWKNADPDQPELIDAKKRLAKLKSTS